ncbi:hypothetical protein C5469_19115 [Photorhabdus cinerea]|uniref:Uncharacterized protein n=1 Tax=Photorhabdus cinerea TaxID=471575 RepID=A0A7X5THR3_9GAMM|nr:hypothetical protein [Photorhabdus cinerea]
MGFYLPTYTIDDWYGAMGNSNMKVAVEGYVDKLNGKDVFVTEQIGMYLKDRFQIAAWRQVKAANKAAT